MSKLLEQTFEKNDHQYQIIDGVKEHHYRTIVVSVDLPDGGTKVWTISRSIQVEGPHPVKHYIDCRTLSGSSRSHNIQGTSRTRLYDSETAFNNAVKRIEKIIEKKFGISK